MKILVTGAHGFLGKNFIKVVEKKHPDWLIVPFQGSILDRHDLDACFASHPDAVVHFAAKVGALASMRHSALYARTNLEGTAHLLSSAVDAGVKRFVQMSTVDVYGSAQRPAEDAPIRPTSPYAITKAAADFLVQQASSIEPFVLRAPSVYGPHDAPNKMIPLFIGKVLSRTPIQMFGDGLQVRDWMHVDDVVRAVLLLLAPGNAPRGIYNLGMPRSWSNLEVTRMLLDALGKPDHPVVHVEDVAGHGRRYCAAYSKISALGFRPQLMIEKEIPSVVRWYLDNVFASTR